MSNKEDLDLLDKFLNNYINNTLVNEEWGVYFIKALVEKIRNMKIEIYSNDHNPPHFHVKSNDKSINATFRLDNGEYINGDINGKDLKRVKAFYNNNIVQEKMKAMWNKSKPKNKQVE